jgi:hypothetical protein
MITGFNTDIEFNGRVFHVQTEDKGLVNPVIETLVYVGGQIVCARKSTYAELLAQGGLPDGTIQQRMETQHRATIGEIRDGSLTQEDLEPFGWRFVSNRSFDEVVRAFLAEEVRVERIQLQWIEPEELCAGQTSRLKVAVIDETSERPVSGVRVAARLVGKNRPSVELFAGVTDESGIVERTCEIPASPGVGAAVVCQAAAEGLSAELSRRVRRRAVSAGGA